MNESVISVMNYKIRDYNGGWIVILSLPLLQYGAEVLTEVAALLDVTPQLLKAVLPL
jgi:hypothetical protein